MLEKPPNYKPMDIDNDLPIVSVTKVDKRLAYLQRDTVPSTLKSENINADNEKN